MNKLIEKLYEAEINASISWFFDRGVAVKLGDEFNGYLEEGTFNTVDEGMKALSRWAKKHYSIESGE